MKKLNELNNNNIIKLISLNSIINSELSSNNEAFIM